MRTNNNTQSKRVRQGAYLALVEKIYNEDNKPTRYSGSIESMLREYFSKTSKKKYLWKRRTLRHLLIHLYHQKCYALLRTNRYVNVLYNISAFGNRIVRPIENWENKYSNEEEQLNALIRHCFTIYETPRFLEHAFYTNEKRHMLWYVQLGRGKSVKSLSSMPVELTSKMAHAFRNAPSFLTVNEALRYAQAVGFGASTKVAKLIAFSRLSIIRERQEAFWATVVHFFAKQEDLNVNEVNSLIDYIAAKYRENPSYSMKNRSYKALSSQSEEWHRLVFLKEKGESYSWKASGIEPLYVEEVVDNKTIIYRTVELRSSGALFEEGSAMQHCVSDYDEDCKEGRCSIFSLRREVEGEPMERLATLEIELPSFEIVQAQSKYNRDPDGKTMALIGEWIHNSQVQPNREVVETGPYTIRGQDAYDRYVERRRVREVQDLDSAIMIKILIWLLYFIFKVMTA